uniref:Uncharacterized protein n=1 Tax=Gadus morhua TaxID=8049 RepID=A0A8C5D0B8_GADMO
IAKIVKPPWGLIVGAFRYGSWTPTRSEWLYAARCIQREENERIV